jgi:hypothetical protein
MKRSVLIPLGILAALVLALAPAALATTLAPRDHDDAVAAAAEWLAADAFLGASEFEAVQTSTCDRCLSQICTTDGAKCGKKGSGCYCRTCNGSFDCWKGRR